VGACHAGGVSQSDAYALFRRVNKPSNPVSVPNLPTQSSPGAPTFEDEEALEDEEGDVCIVYDPFFLSCYFHMWSRRMSSLHVTHVRCAGG
jgi:hypothetical protein